MGWELEGLGLSGSLRWWALRRFGVSIGLEDGFSSNIPVQ